MTKKLFKIALLTGGPSLERGISLNSARSVLDHLSSEKVEIVPIYFDYRKKAYKISSSQLYSNTPSDFDFKLSEHATPLNQTSLIKLLKSADIVFPAMHGPFGEDGQIQNFLEKHNIPFVGSGSRACKMAFDKYEANKHIAEKGFHTMPSVLLKIYSKDNKKIIDNFFKKNKIKRAIIKPATGGSSIGVFSVNSPAEALLKANLLFSKRMDTRVVLEPFAKGKEFTVIVLENKLGLPVALIPSEIEMTYHEGRIFDFRKKYLPTNQVAYHCPPRFQVETIKKIQTEAKQIFSLFGMNDFARFDGWVFPDGRIWFSDFNTVSGMEQNSFLFQQSSQIGMSHSDFLNFVVRNASRRYEIDFPEQEAKKSGRKPVSVIFGGGTSERQVSLMSGTNVWLKLKKSKKYNPKPYLLDFKNNVWELPYGFILNHTVEEILYNATNAKKNEKKTKEFVEAIKAELLLEKNDTSEPLFLPRKMSFNEFLKNQKFVFLGLHGGDGENGKIQKILADKKIKFNGSGEVASRICMDKYGTGELVRGIKIPSVSTPYQKVLLVKNIKSEGAEKIWKKLTNDLLAKTLIVKPKDDGCSTGVAHLYRVEDLENYMKYVVSIEKNIPAGVLKKQNNIIEMPQKKLKELLFEKFIETDILNVKGNKLKHIRKNGWVEVTIGILEERGKLHALNPSITIAEGEVLSVEEKFQGGTGVNLTPPPKGIVKDSAIKNAKENAEKLVKEIGLRGYARIDAFMKIDSGKLLVIEVNTLPALTPSTVLYQQALSERTPIYPRELIEKIIRNSGY